MRHPRRNTARAGFTMIEVVIAASILVVLVGITMMAFSRSSRQMGESMVIADLAQRADQIEDRIQELLRSAGNFDLDDEHGTPNVGYDRVNFSEVLGYNLAGKTPQLAGTGRSIRWVASTINNRFLPNDGMLKVFQGNTLLFDLGSDVKLDDFRVGYYEPTSNTASGAQTAAGNFVELRVAFTLMGVLAINANNQAQIHEERRVVRVSIRN